MMIAQNLRRLRRSPCRHRVVDDAESGAERIASEHRKRLWDAAVNAERQGERDDAAQRLARGS